MHKMMVCMAAFLPGTEDHKYYGDNLKMNGIHGLDRCRSIAPGLDCIAGSGVGLEG
jgi:hypothetical protein